MDQQELTPEQKKAVARAKITLWAGIAGIVAIGTLVAVYFVFLREGSDGNINSQHNTNTAAVNATVDGSTTNNNSVNTSSGIESGNNIVIEGEVEMELFRDSDKVYHQVADEKIAYTVPEDGIYIYDGKTKTAEKIIDQNDGRKHIENSFSPDGKSILLVTEKDNISTLSVYNFYSREESELVRGSENQIISNVGWSPDSAMFYYALVKFAEDDRYGQMYEGVSLDLDINIIRLTAVQLIKTINDDEFGYIPKIFGFSHDNMSLVVANVGEGDPVITKLDKINVNSGAVTHVQENLGSVNDDNPGVYCIDCNNGNYTFFDFSEPTNLLVVDTTTGTLDSYPSMNKLWWTILFSPNFNADHRIAYLYDPGAGSGYVQVNALILEDLMTKEQTIDNFNLVQSSQGPVYPYLIGWFENSNEVIFQWNNDEYLLNLTDLKAKKIIHSYNFVDSLGVL
ncbi:MAG: hypothetical protein PHY34_01895 [Patescibacteria group bacterium]|nr:hypothetical protein [Patescibacteria group bacterium]MDD5715313.1 hypothetical protein [Patescibacteria group bacterium]